MRLDRTSLKLVGWHIFLHNAEFFSALGKTAPCRCCLGRDIHRKGRTETKGSVHSPTQCHVDVLLLFSSRKVPVPNCFEHLTLLFSYLYLVIGHRIMLWWSTIKDQETSVQSDWALTYDSQGNNLDGGLSAWVLIENVCVVNRETLCLSDYPEAQHKKRYFFPTHKSIELYQRYLNDSFSPSPPFFFSQIYEHWNNFQSPKF